MSSIAQAQPPKLWKYLLAALTALILLIPAWTLFVMLVIQPSTLMQEQTLGKQLLWWVAGPVIVVACLAGWRWQVASSQVQPARVAQQIPTAQAQAAAEQARREYVLEVISLGVTLDKYRQGKLWEALSKGHAFASIREQDPMKYPWSAGDKEAQEGSRSGDALENGA